MRNFVYALVSVSLITSISFFGLKSQAADDAVGQISVIKNYPYQIVENMANGQTQTVAGQSSSIDPAEIIPDLSLPYYPEDKIKAFPDPNLGIGSTITIDRAPLISVKDGKRSKQYRSWSSTVGELLVEQNIELGADDKISPVLDAQIFDGSNVIITRVAITTVVETETVNYKIIEKEDPNLNYGKKRTDPGEKGEKKLTYRVTREDGEEVSRVLLSSEVTKEPKSQINYTGTKVTVLSSVSGRATMTPVSTYIVSPNYKRGTLIRITNRSNGKKIIVTVNATWGTASPPAGVVLDLAPTFLSQLGCPSHGCSSVLVEEIAQ